jgi:hypothetical protein
MDREIVAIYVVCDDALKLLDQKDDFQAVMSTAEVITFSIIASRLFGGNHSRARWFCQRVGYLQRVLSS